MGDVQPSSIENGAVISMVTLHLWKLTIYYTVTIEVKFISFIRIISNV